MPRRHHQHRGTQTAIITVLILVHLHGGGARAEPENPDSLRGSTPYIPLFTEASSCPEIKQLNSFSDEELRASLDDLATWYVHVHAETSNSLPFGTACRGTSATTLASKLTKRGVWVSNYRNGSYVSQSTVGGMNFHEAASLERRAPLSIATFWPGNHAPSAAGDDGSNAARLVRPLTQTSRIVRVRAVGHERPQGSPGTWPYQGSRGKGRRAGSFSLNTHDLVSWVRIDDELLKVLSAPRVVAGIVILHVRRGLFGTDPIRHGAGTRVMAPVYIGSKTAAARDAGMDGTPARDSRSFPLRYGIKIWTSRGIDWIGDRIRSTFGSDLQGHDAIWLDNSGCGQYNNAAASGHAVFGWDDRFRTKLTPDAWGSAQGIKLSVLRQRFSQAKMIGNSFTFSSACNDGLLSGSVDAGVLENWARVGTWRDAVALSFKIQGQNWPALYWVRWRESGGSQYRRLAYGTLLLTYRPSADRFQFGGPWRLGPPDPLFFWDLGSPHGTPSTLADVAVDGSDLYARSFDHGMVLVNPTAESVTYALPVTYYDALDLTAEGLPQPVTMITVPARDASFLLDP